MRIQVCGRPALERDGRRVESALPGRQGRLLFAYLVVHRLRPITRDALVDALWADRPPAAADVALSALLSKVRRVLAPGELRGTTVLEVWLPADARVDLEHARRAMHRAESALALGDPHAAWAPSQAALFAARRGFLAGEDAPWIADVRRELDDLQTRALEAHGLACLRIGGTELPAAERCGRAMVARSPYAESGHRLVMEALAERGEVAEALRVYEVLRARLRDELGIVPCAATRELHERLLGRALSPR